MNIESFYAENEQRRASAEIEIGTDWRDAAERRYELSWVQDTGELYLMREPSAPVSMDGFGDSFTSLSFFADHNSDEETVLVIATVPTHDELEVILEGWADAEVAPKGVEWLIARVRDNGVAAI